MSAATGAAALAEELAPHGARRARLALVLGSGLGALVEALEGARVVPAATLAHYPASTVPGHAGSLAVGELGGVPVIVQQGRIHLYEGRPTREVTRAVRAFALLGVRGILLTNAAGSLERGWAPGELMRIEDHLNLQGRAPLPRAEAGSAAVYDPGLAACLDRAAARSGITLRRGVYAGLLGPSYETPAEIEMLRRLGARAVGMSTVAEATVARSAGMRVAGISCLTNHAAGIGDERLRHEDVLQAGQRASHTLAGLIEASLADLARELEAPSG